LANVPLVYALSLGLGFLNAFDNPARRGFVTELVDEHEITNAVSLNTAVMTGSRIFGPAIAALLVGPLGTGWLFVANGVSYAAIIVVLLAIDRSALRTPPLAPPGGTPVRDALRFVRGSATLLSAFVAFTVISTFGFNFGVALPKLADLRWGGDQWYGWILATTSVGSLSGSLLTAGRRTVSTRWFVASGLVMGLAGIALAWAPNPAVALLLAVPLGLGGAGVVTGMNAILQQECPAEMRSRMMALTAVAFLGSTPIGGPITGWVGDTLGVEWSLAYGGVVTLVSSAVLALRTATTDVPAPATITQGG
jgi:MFS family permease